MPRIDPIQLLKCLSVLLSPEGGIKSRDEVQRLANLMTKFSKKLVSKCIYIQILKCTETELLGLFMGSGGWRLAHMWLTESIVAKNWPLVRELLELLLLCPVDIDRLKTNNCPKLVKELSKDGNLIAIRILATRLVEQWLKTVKGEEVIPIPLVEIPKIVTLIDDNINTRSHDLDDKMLLKLEINGSSTDLSNCDDQEMNHILNKSESAVEGIDIKNNENAALELEKEAESLPILKITLKDGKQVISQIEDPSNKDSTSEKTKHKSKSNEKSHSSSTKSSSKHSSKSHTSSGDKHRSSSPGRRSSTEKLRDKHRHSHSSKSSSSKSNDKKYHDRSNSDRHKEDRLKHKSDYAKHKDDKSKEKIKNEKEQSNISSLEKIQQPSINKLGKIPKLNDSKKDSKHSISIEVRKPDDPKPKTVKTFNSRFRKHGLEEEVKPPPSRASLLNNKKTPSVIPPTVPVPKRPSPVHNEIPPEKKAKTVELVEKPGAIKLIPPKPKPMLLLESDMFMDALNASATNKKEPKKRKRRISGSKDGNSSMDTSPPHTPNIESKPLRFYQDTLETDDDKDKNNEKGVDEDNTKAVQSPRDDEKIDDSPSTKVINGLKGVLCYHKKKGPKKSIKWKTDLEEIQYFELDETERVNVTKTFTDMKHLERIHEREAFEKARNISTDDVMEEKTNWRPLIPIDLDGQVVVENGKNSKEKDIQAIRQKGTLQPLYFHKAMIPESPLEPDPETQTYTDPSVIPLDDITGNQDNVTDFRNMPWPEPKGNAPPNVNTNTNVPPIFPTNMNQFPNGFPNSQFTGFQGPNMVPGEWQNGLPNPLMGPNGMPVGPMGPVGMPPGIMLGPDGVMVNPEMFPNPMAFPPMAPDNFNMMENIPQNMFPPDFNMNGPPMMGPEGPMGLNFRGGMRGRGAAGHWRGKGNTNTWDGPSRGRGGPRGGRKAVCIYFQRKGSCRQGDNCTFLHPGVNCPY